MQKPLIPALFICLLFAFGCGKSTDDQPENADTWVVSLLEFENVDKDLTDSTSLFTGYEFEFNADNTIAIINPNGIAQEGKWENPSSAVYEIVVAKPVPPVVYLQGTWEVVEHSSDVLELKVTIDDPVNVFAKSRRVKFIKL
ncbi:MAG: hypothetical protein R3D58_06155 [Saprospiraceae bacterium]|jgi:hypothetical protein|nr:hypothetical protein [Lewinellaceae bacterium]